MFILRCVFWLSIVYGSMSWGGDALRGHGSFAATTSAGAAEMSAVAHRVVAGVQPFCAGRELQCVSDAARLTELVENVVARGEAADIIEQEPTRSPVTPKPRRHAASPALTPRP